MPNSVKLKIFIRKYLNITSDEKQNKINGTSNFCNTSLFDRDGEDFVPAFDMFGLAVKVKIIFNDYRLSTKYFLEK